ncbi:MAG: hypothetical protein JXM73_12475 [Anaerolineae bacterium]|nr:hypothetical protein [Anaerolineae bacterium]
MKRLFTVFTVVFVMLMVASTAFAATPPQKPDGLVEQSWQAFAPAWDPWEFDPAYTILGSVWDFEFWLTDPGGFLAPFTPVDIWLWAPSTTGGWPLAMAQTAGTWFLPIGASEVRRQTWPTYQMTDSVGYYYSEFMLPRDEVWYPCSYPCKWKCNFWDPIQGIEIYHSPLVQVFVYRQPVGSFWYLLYPLYWPWAGDPMDTVAPLTAWAFLGNGVWVENAYWEFEIEGYYWTTRDLEVEWPADWPFICPWM